MTDLDSLLKVVKGEKTFTEHVKSHNLLDNIVRGGSTKKHCIFCGSGGRVRDMLSFCNKGYACQECARNVRLMMETNN